MEIKTDEMEIEARDGGFVYVGNEQHDIFSNWDTLKTEAIPEIRQKIQEIKQQAANLLQMIKEAVQPDAEETVIGCKGTA